MALAGQVAPVVHPAADQRDELHYHSRWVFSQLNGFASTAIAGNLPLALVVVYDLSPAAAFGLAQRSVYTPTGKASLSRHLCELPNAYA